MKLRKKLIWMLLAIPMLGGCTKLEEEVYDKYPAEEFYASPEGADVALAGV